MMYCSDVMHNHADTKDNIHKIYLVLRILHTVYSMPGFPQWNTREVCYDDYGPNKVIQINSSKENLSFIINRGSNTMSNWKGMKI